MTPREEALAKGQLWTYGYSQNEDFRKRLADHFGSLDTVELSQYDLEVFFFLNYAYFPATGETRDEHFWRAAELRWPTTTHSDGKLEGHFIRHEWAEKFIWAASNYVVINELGGSGQGKTTAPVALAIIVWDYYVHTVYGARVVISSVSEAKLRQSAWSHLIRLYQNSDKSCSRFVGNGVDRDLAIRRPKPYDRDELGIIKCVLVGTENKGSKSVDKLTGAHVPTAIVVIIDEAQSTPETPVKAVYNLFTRPEHKWLIRAGNPDLKDDLLGKSCEPDGGYDDVDPLKNPDAPVVWETNYNDYPGIVLRFDNDLSPGMKDPIRYGFLPTARALASNYPNDESRRTAQYYRFWKAWFVPEFADEAVIKHFLIEQMECHKMPEHPRGVPLNALSYDSAPSSLDRSICTHFQLIEDGPRRVLYFRKVFEQPKTAKEVFWQKAADYLITMARELNVPSGNLIEDETSAHGLRALLSQKGFHAIGMKYHEKPTEKWIDCVARKKACDYAANLMTEAAMLLEAYIRYGQVRGLDESLLPPGNTHSFREEVCTRRIEELPTGKLRLESKRHSRDSNGNNKKGFSERMGFSPDIFDTLCQAALFARDHWNLQPGLDTPSAGGHGKSHNKINTIAPFQRRYAAFTR